MPRNLDIAVEDIITAIARIEETVDGVDFVQFSSDWRTRYIIERCLQIVSEASRAIPDDLKARHPNIKWIGVRDIGNALRHQYASVSPSRDLERRARRIAKASSGGSKLCASRPRRAARPRSPSMNSG